MSNGHSTQQTHSTALATTQPASTSLATHDPRSVIAPRTLAEVESFAESAAATGLCGCKSVEEAFVRIAMGMEAGMTPLASMRGVYIIEGRPALSADALVGVCQKSALCEHFRLVESTDKVATYAVKRKGDPEIRFSYTIDQAKTAGLTGRKTWAAHPAAMLRARASSQAARAIFPDLVNGLYSTDEINEIRDEPLGPPVQYDVAPPATKASVVDAVVEPAKPRVAKPAPVAEAPKAVEPASPAPDFDAMAEQANTEIRALTTIEACQAYKAQLAKLAPKASPHRATLIALLTAQHASIVKAAEKAPEPEPAQSDDDEIRTDFE